MSSHSLAGSEIRFENEKPIKQITNLKYNWQTDPRSISSSNIFRCGRIRRSKVIRRMIRASCVFERCFTYCCWHSPVCFELEMNGAVSILGGWARFVSLNWWNFWWRRIFISAFGLQSQFDWMNVLTVCFGLFLGRPINRRSPEEELAPVRLLDAILAFLFFFGFSYDKILGRASCVSRRR